MSIPVYRHLREDQWKKEPLHKLVFDNLELFTIVAVVIDVVT